MTQESIQTRYTLDPALASATELEQAIAQAIEANKQDFFPLLERLVDVGDSRVKLSQKEPLQVLGVELDEANTGGTARLHYESNFAESCRLIDEYDQHQTSVAFHLDGDQLVFDLELPIAWNFDN
ncbi:MULTISPECIES: hypothetical protein [Aeromonas]|uniref:hypothetical protein n=1 Tax=Aeromonas TaxID=642 RepID=UPI000CDCA9F8|nr:MULTISPECIES: hypothetical protein [Aeromonas]AUZ79109.1 hypothetical protein C2U37_05055 [Aeromonas sp. ASNIH1]MDX7613112.1 hypothetical protein [Aeromonas caviae]MDX7689253.1 hypothetical protein [Aeromonas caviae]MDX7769124.1 hypothetical protein [Aeromonas caviae]MDX7848657.1 hypothetical protein [Aeromonas caviae]